MPRRENNYLDLTGWLSPTEAANLRDEIGKWIEASNAATALINEQHAEIIRLRTALTVYADDRNWLGGAGVVDWIRDSDPQMIARKALEGI